MALLQTAGKRPDNLFPVEGASWKDRYNIPAGTDSLVNLEIIGGNGVDVVFGVGVSGITSGQAQLLNALPTGSLLIDATNGRIIWHNTATTWLTVSGGWISF